MLHPFRLRGSYTLSMGLLSPRNPYLVSGAESAHKLGADCTETYQLLECCRRPCLLLLYDFEA